MRLNWSALVHSFIKNLQFTLASFQKPSPTQWKGKKIENTSFNKLHFVQYLHNLYASTSIQFKMHIPARVSISKTAQYNCWQNSNMIIECCVWNNCSKSIKKKTKYNRHIGKYGVAPNAKRCRLFLSVYYFWLQMRLNI